MWIFNAEGDIDKSAIQSRLEDYNTFLIEHGYDALTLLLKKENYIKVDLLVMKAKDYNLDKNQKYSRIIELVEEIYNDL